MEKMEFVYRFGNSLKACLIGLTLIAALPACDSNMDAVEKDMTTKKATTPNKSATSQASRESACGFQGLVYNQPMTGIVSNAIITFSKSDEAFVMVASSDSYGFYQVTLKPGKYYVTVTASGYNSYSSAPGFFVCTGINGYQTGNFFLEAEIASGFQGVVFNAYDFNITIPNSYITFTKSDNPSIIYSTFSSAYGDYKINLPQASYYAKAQASGYATYDSSPGLFVVTGSGYQTGNFFLDPLKEETR